MLCAATAAFLLACVAAASADKALDILQKSVRASGQVPHRATVAIKFYRNGAVARTFVQEIIKDTGRRQRVEVVAPKSEIGRLIVSDGLTKSIFDPGKKLVYLEQVSSLRDVQQHKLHVLNLFRQTLHATYVATGTVAQRDCHIVAVSPPDGKRIRKQVWVDAQTNIELKTERYAPDGRLVVSWAMTSVDFHPQIDSSVFEFLPPKGCTVRQILRAPRMALAKAESLLGFRAIVPSYLPPGFALLRDQVGVVKTGRHREHHALWMEFLNGVDSFSIYQSRPVKPPPGATQAMYWETEGFSLILIGPIPQEHKQLVKESTQD